MVAVSMRLLNYWEDVNVYRKISFVILGSTWEVSSEWCRQVP